MKEDANAPFESHLQATSGGCENVHLRVNHTICMRAEIGPKRDRALARAGCYFDGDATACGVNAFAICEERGILFIGRDCARRVQTSALRPRHYGRKTTNPSVVLQGKYGLCRSARNEGHSVALSRVRVSAPCALTFPCATATRLIAASLAMTVDIVSRSRGVDRPPLNFERAGRPGARCTRGLACRMREQNPHEHAQAQRKHSGLPCAVELRLMASASR